MDIEDKKQIIESCLEDIAGISDKEYQKRVWIRGEGPECDSFDETVCTFFQNGGGVVEDYKNFPITDEQYQVLKKFHDEFRIFVDETDFPELMTETDEWAKIMESAKEVLKAFNYKNRA